MIADRQDTLTMPRDWVPSPDALESRDPTGASAAMSDRRIAGLHSGAWLELVFLLGLGSVFLVNAAVAIVEPAGFQELVAASPVGGLIGGAAWIAPLIAVNDFLIGTSIIAAYRIRMLRAPVLAWAGLWLLMVTVMKATTMG